VPHLVFLEMSGLGFISVWLSGASIHASLSYSVGQSQVSSAQSPAFSHSAMSIRSVSSCHVSSYPGHPPLMTSASLALALVALITPPFRGAADLDVSPDSRAKPRREGKGKGVSEAGPG